MTEIQRGIIESLRLQKTSNIMKSNHQPTTIMPAVPRPEVNRKVKRIKVL